MKTATSPRTAIANHCKGCTYDSQCVGNWRQQVEACAITDCELFEHRPLTGKTKRLRRENDLSMLSVEQQEIAEIRRSQRALNMRNLRRDALAAPMGRLHDKGSLRAGENSLNTHHSPLEVI